MTDKKRLEIGIEMINKMFEIAGHAVTYNDIVGRKDAWYQEWTMTTEQREEWIKWGKAYLKKKFRWPKYLVDREMAMFDLMYGLTEVRTTE